MNALKQRIKRQKAATRKERDIQAAEHNAISDTMDAMIYATAIVLHDRYGFGTKRLSDVFKDVETLVNDYAEYYGSDYLFFALKRKCEERGIIFDMEGSDTK